MAIIEGSLITPMGIFKRGLLAGKAPEESMRSGMFGAMLPIDSTEGSFTSGQPIIRVPLYYNGEMMRTYFEDYYNRIWFIPSVVDFGPITANTSTTVYIWNSHLRPVSLNQIIPSDDPSVHVVDLNTPATIRPLGTLVFDVAVDGDGQPSINSETRFQFEPFEIKNLRVTGVRARLWDFMPSWKEGFEVTLEYRSDIITSRSGREQRRALRQLPRKSISFTTMAHDERFRRFVRHMSVWQQRSTVMPEFSRSVHTTAPLTSGQGSIAVDETPFWLRAGALVAIMTREMSILRTISGVVGNLVSFTSAISGEWPAGTRIFCAHGGRLSPSLQGSQVTNRTLMVNASFDVDPGSEDWPEPPAPDVTYRGREVMLKRPNWSSPLNPEFQATIEQVDYGVGRTATFTPVLFNDRVHKAEYLGIDREDVEDYVNFFRRQYGQVGEFFMPTFTEDLSMMKPSPEGGATMRIAGTGTADDYREGLVYRDLIIFLSDGTYLIRRIHDIYAVDDVVGKDTIIQVTENFPVDLNPSTVRQICWLPLWRLISDGLTITFVSDEAAQLSMNMKTLEHLGAEG